MKTFKTFALLTALAIGTFSCNQEEVTPDLNGQPTSYSDFDYNEGPLSYDTEDPVKTAQDRDYSNATATTTYPGTGGSTSTADK